MLAAAVILAQLAGSPPAPDVRHPGWTTEREVSSLAENIDKATQACDMQVLERTPEGRASQKTLAAKGVEFTDSAPPYVTMFSGGKFGAARYHRWLDPHAEIWLVAYTTTEACRVVIYNSEYADAARTGLENLITKDGFFRRDDAAGGDEGGTKRSIFIGSLSAAATVYPMISVAGPSQPAISPAGLKLAVTVALIKK